MTIAQIEENVQQVISNFNKEEAKNGQFIYELLAAYNIPSSSIKRLETGNYNISKNYGEISWKKKLFFKELVGEDLHNVMKAAVDSIKHDQRFIVLTDYDSILARDTKTDEVLDVKISELPKHYDFFLPWAGIEKAQHYDENKADVKASEKMAKLFDAIKMDNPDDSPEFIHGLNVFLSRLLFCFFAEDTDIFEDNQVTNTLASHTAADGSDLHEFFDKLFEVLDTPEVDRDPELPAYRSSFPYVNGGLFLENHPAPKFTIKSRRRILEGGEMDWSEINPDIFGSMFQAVISEDQRGNLGQHYTSVSNIMKVIEPLFLNELKEVFEKSKGNKKKLNELLSRLTKLKVFDPACGSGNFLIIAYKELRRLEIEIIRELGEIAYPRISLDQFYGIEIDDFAHEIAQLSLWLAEHQMNVEFFREFGRTKPTLPLKESGNITRDNACRLDWGQVCKNENKDEIYVLGNPPYLGSRLQTELQKKDLDFVFDGIKQYRDLDYISCWFFKAANYIVDSKAIAAFVTTNSICQGDQVALLWPEIFSKNIEIQFAYPSFKWSNSAKKNAGVVVSIVGISNKNSKEKHLFINEHRTSVPTINAYLVGASNVIISKRNKPLSMFPKMPKGNMPYDGGNLIFEEKEYESLIKLYPVLVNFTKRLVGSREFINGLNRYCLWIKDHDVENVSNIDFIKERLERVKQMRLSSSDKSAHKLADRPHQFREINETTTQSIIIPSVSSERREYIPMGFVNSNTIVSNLAFALYEAQPWLLGLLCSRMHMTWVRIVSGRLKSDYRYSSALCYNTFPFPQIAEQRKQDLTQSALRILEERENHPDKTMAELYDPSKMPQGLKEAHLENDVVVEKCYRSKPFESDAERLEYLFKLYEKMIEEEKNKNTLFEKQTKKRKKKTNA